MTEPKQGSLVIRPHPDGGSAIEIDGVDHGKFCTKAVLTIPLDGNANLELTQVVEDTSIEHPSVDVTYYKVCANCARELNAPPAPEAHGPYRTAGALAEGAEVIVIDGTVMKLERQAPDRWRTMPRPPGIPRETDRVVIIRRWLEEKLSETRGERKAKGDPEFGVRIDALEEALAFVNGLGTASECAPPAATEMCPSNTGHALKRVFLPERGLRGKHYCECGWEL